MKKQSQRKERAGRIAVNKLLPVSNQTRGQSPNKGTDFRLQRRVQRALNSMKSNEFSARCTRPCNRKSVPLFGLCPLVPRPSPPAHSTRLGEKCRDVTE